jgi:hypothetical protein
MLDTATTIGTFDVRRYLTTDQGVKQPVSAEALAAVVLEGVQRNRALIVAPGQARVAWRISRLSPRAVVALGRRAVAQQRRGSNA